MRAGVIFGDIVLLPPINGAIGGRGTPESRRSTLGFGDYAQPRHYAPLGNSIISAANFSDPEDNILTLSHRNARASPSSRQT